MTLYDIHFLSQCRGVGVIEIHGRVNSIYLKLPYVFLNNYVNFASSGNYEALDPCIGLRQPICSRFLPSLETRICYSNIVSTSQNI